MSVEKEIRKILGEATPASVRAKKELVRSGLGHDKNAAAVMKALQDPEAAMKNPAKREMLLKVMQDLLDVVVNDPTMVTKTKMALRKEEIEEVEELEELDEKLHPNQKKLDKNKNGKLDAEDFKKLRGEAKKDDEDNEETGEKEDDDDKEEMIAKMKNGKGFKAFMKKEGYVSHAQRKAVWASRNDEKEAKKRKMKEEVQVDESAWGKDKAANMKAALDRHSEKAIAANKAGDDAAVKVHQAKMNAIKNKMAKLAKEDVQIDELKKSTLASYTAKSSKSAAGLATNAMHHKNTSDQYAKLGNAKKSDEFSKHSYDATEKQIKRQKGVDSALKRLAKESVTTDYNLVKGQAQNKAPTKKLVTDYKLATKKVAKEDLDINESGGPVVFKKGEHHVEKYSDDSFALYKSGKKQKFYPTLAAAKTAMKEDIQIDEAFPTVADAKKRMKDALKSKFEKKKISTGTVYTKKYKDEKDDEKKEK
jgi:hypothetical protein